MRAVWIGLVCAVMGISQVQAKSCPLTRATVEIMDDGMRLYGTEPVERAMVGKRFRVTRYTDNPHWRPSKNPDELFDDGYEAYELSSGQHTVLVRQDRIEGSPARTTDSWRKGAGTQHKVAWKRSAPKRVTTGEKLDYPLSGPLAAFVIVVAACR